MNIDIHKLRLILNYDTNEKNVLSFDERLEVHKGIADSNHRFPELFEIKLLKTLQELRNSGYISQDVRYQLDQNFKIITIKY